MADIVLQGRAISKSFGVRRARHQVLFDVDIQVRAGECLAVIGGSGSGKTTLTRILLSRRCAGNPAWCSRTHFRRSIRGGPLPVRCPNL